jgi:predicted nucleotide-binding protein
VSVSKNLFQYANDLSEFESSNFHPIKRIVEVANEIEKAWSGSWLGYHSRVYYSDFEIPPPGDIFSQEWGLLNSYSDRKNYWLEYNFDEVIKLIHSKAGDPDLKPYFIESAEASEKFDVIKSEVLSIIHSNISLDEDKFLTGLVNNIESEKILTKMDFIEHRRPSGQMMSRDTIAIEKGLSSPPHIAIQAKYFASEQPFNACKSLKKHITKLASHIHNLEKKTVREDRIGTNVFIGHGRSFAWRDLKDFVSERLSLPWDEFNSVPVAGLTNITRLAQMLDQASIAFLIMTAEDEQADGNSHARMNVIHEVGLFQGRLGFEKAIVLLEEGCEEFSNIQGLGQIRFPKGNISAIFEDIRQVLEREGIIE